MVKISNWFLIDDSQPYVWICELTTIIVVLFAIYEVDSIYSFK